MEKKLKKFKISFKPMFEEMTYDIEAETEEEAMDTAYDRHVENVGRDNAKDFEVSNCYEDHEDRFDRLVVFDVTFCLMNKNGNELKDKNGNARVFYNENADYDDLAENALIDSGISDVVNEREGWRETKNPFAKENKND
tara:strand:+ start:378 stop:794 length:417 start_codon:yes stop_codon:yes gene_type:complete